MPVVPRIQRTLPNGPVTQAPEPIAVIATIRWHGGHTSEEQALALAWTRTEVEVRWTDPWGADHEDWVPAEDVRRPGVDHSAPSEARQDSPRSTGRKQRW